ncbi:SGNH/GDSL hydrolase family protein [Prosthecobacter sp.]|uniref:SGNH/GDSL hydrolase family protein n=1 Tax=Prosthecobacter sp. TaxID=1965333 RepID=UPI002ABB351F|nr:SGNH/GDSL hydrolase family protein [Prosthecobacter sp.]MDZ4405407.1 SGNH/GDSL hydrolase family protein [Prosthecobacter sp.]
MIRAFLLLLALTLGVLAQNSTKPRTVIVFGDSITAGGAWVKQVEKESAGTLTLINEGKGGRPTNSVKEFEAMLQRHLKTDALVIALGMNDSRDITAECVPKAVANLRAMIEKARAAYGVKLPLLLVGPTNINKAALGPTKPIGDQREAKLRELSDAFAKLATETHSEFVSLFGVVPDVALLKDGVHPDAAGNAAIAKVMGERMKSWLVD